MFNTASRVRGSVAAVGVAISVAIGIVGAAPAHATGATQIAGIQWVGLPCDSQAAVTFTMTGSLTGCWYGDSFTPTVATPSGVLVATGTEHFVGCVAARCGTLSFTFTFTGKYADPGVFAQEIRGACEHKVVSSGGGLIGTTGFIRFTDDVVNNISPYTGHLSLGGPAGTASSLAPHLRDTTAAAC